MNIGRAAPNGHAVSKPGQSDYVRISRLCCVRHTRTYAAGLLSRLYMTPLDGHEVAAREPGAIVEL